MISIEAIKYLGKNVLAIRSWDGYDHPIKTPIFKITEEEIDFKGGRFKRFTIALKHPIKKIAFSTKQFDIEKMIEWIAGNTEGLWYFDISDDSAQILKCIGDEFSWHVWIFWFKDEDDYIKFILKWT